MNVVEAKKRACLSRFAIWCSYFISLGRLSWKRRKREERRNGGGDIAVVLQISSNYALKCAGSQ